MAEPEVTYTVKDMLAQMEKRADERHAETQRSIRSVDNRVSGLIKDRIEPLERDRNRRQGSNAAVNRMWVVGVAMFGMIVSIPSLVHVFT